MKYRKYGRAPPCLLGVIGTLHSDVCCLIDFLVSFKYEYLGLQNFSFWIIKYISFNFINFKFSIEPYNMY